MSPEEKKPKESRTVPGYLEVPTSVFVGRVDVNMPPLPPIALYRMDRGTPVLLRGPDQPFSALVLSQYDTVWIRDGDFRLIKDHAEAALSAPELNAGLAPQKRVQILRRTAILVVEDLFQDPSPENITRSGKVVGSFVQLLMKEPQAFLFLTRLSSHDAYTLQHSVGTSVNAIILARKIGVKTEAELMEAGIAGLLHDIGKVQIRKELLNKTGPLTEAEWQEMKQHSKAGFEMIQDRADITDRSKRAVLEHHEDLNGTGYPYGIRAMETDVFSRIICVCDVFNALTTDRSYSKARTPFEAFQFMKEKLTHKIDPELFRAIVLIYGGLIE
jgi:putative nucleotidyltransferase with HDIG domain